MASWAGLPYLGGMPRPVLILICLPLMTAIALAWWWPNHPRLAGLAVPAARLNSVSFAPFRDGQSPLTGRFPTAAQVDADLALVAARTRAIRTYASIEGEYDIPALAERHGLKVWLGIWLGSDRASNTLEVARGIQLARAHPATVERLVVGNEVLLRRDLPPAEVIAALDQVRAAVPQPVTYADVWEFWEQYPEVAAHVDIVTIHLLPYWEDEPTGIEGAVAHVGATHRRIAARFPGKPVAIGETGWPSRGRPRDGAVPGRVEQARFVREFVALAAAEGFDYNLIEAFDQGWKYKSEGVVGANWGLWTADRLPKFPMAGAVVEDPAWPTGAAASVVAGLLLLGAALAAQPGLRERAQVGLAVLAMALGTAVAYAHTATWPVVYDPHLGLAAVVNLPGQMLLAALAVRRAARVLGGHGVAPARAGLDVSDAIRGLLRGRWRGGITADGLVDDLAFLFLWAAAVLQLLLLFDPRYRDFPLATLAVPAVVVLGRFALRDLPVADLLPGAGRAELAAGGTLALAAMASTALEGPANTAALAWLAMALVLAAPPLMRVRWRRAAR